MSNLTVFSQAGLPAVSSLTTALRAVAPDVASGVTVFLKMDKTGAWVFGADQEEVEDDSLWAVNPFSFLHGFIAWGEGEVLGEKMVPVTQPVPEVGPAPAGAKYGWQAQVGFSLKCISGQDKGMEARFATNSLGGRKAAQALAVAIAEQVEKDQANPVPVVKLKKDSYIHKSYGKVIVPVFDVQKWIGMDGDAPAEAEADAPAEEPRRRRRAA